MNSNSAFKYSVDSEGIGHLVFDLPGEKVNTISDKVLNELSNTLDQIADDEHVKVLLVESAKEDSFIAGADLRTFETIFDHLPQVKTLVQLGHHVFGKLAQLKIPTIAAIHGTCVGGGLELALACKYRVLSDHPKSIIAAPEVLLGIIPGWGGTQRLPRLVGLMNGLDMILTGKNIKPSQARKIKIVDALYPWEFFKSKSLEFARTVMTDQGRKQIRAQRERKGLYSWFIEKTPFGRRLLFKKAKAQVIQKTQGHYPAPLIALEVIQSTYQLPLEEGLREEVEVFVESAPKEFQKAKNLIHLFFLQEALKKNPGYDKLTTPKSLKHVNVIGAGTMGSTIAWLLSYNDYWVRFKDVNWDLVGKGYAIAKDLYQKYVKEKRLKSTEANLKFHHLSGTIDYSGFNQTDLVIEAATENLELKHKIFKELEEAIPQDAIIASNTSSLTIEEMSKGMKNPERFLGMHFFNPPQKMPLVEIVPGKHTTPEAVSTAVALCKKLNKTALVVGDCAGFLVNRIFAVCLNEAMWLLEEGVPLEEIDRAMVHFGMPMGPFTVADEVGNDVCYKVGLTFEKAYGDRMEFPSLGHKMYEEHLSGKKTGKGFYIHQGKEKKPNPGIDKLLPAGTVHESVPEKTIVERITFMMINEGMRCLEEKIVKEPGQVDIGVVFGLGFPPFRGGLLRYADSVGLHYILTQMKQYEQAYGKRFAPCKLLQDLGEKHQKLYSK